MAYQNLRAATGCRIFNAQVFTGRAYNTTIAYKPEELSTSMCLHGMWKPINYTQLQYPLPNSVLVDEGCLDPGYGPLFEESGDINSPGTAPYFSYPANVVLLNPAWKSCTTGMYGVYDPPRMLNQATAMVPVASSVLHAAPGAFVTPSYAPATPIPTIGTPQGEAKASSSSPKALAGSDSEMQPSVPEADASKSNPASRTASPNDDGHYSKYSTSNDRFSGHIDSLSSKDPSEDGSILIGTSIVASVTQMSAESPDFIQPNPSLGPSTSSTLVQTPNLGSVIASVFAFMPSPMAEAATQKPVTSPEGSGPGDVAPSVSNPPSFIVNGITTALRAEAPEPARTQLISFGGQGETLRQASTQIVLGGQTANPGGPAISASGVTVSIPALPDPNVDSNPDAAPPLAEAVYTVGGQTFVANPTRIAIQRSTIKAGEIPLTISGTPIRLQSSGNLIVGDSTFQVSPTKADPQASTAVPSAQSYVVGDQTFRGNPSALSMAGTTLSAGESGIDIAGTMVSLQPSGGLIIGDSTVLMSPTDSSSEFPAATTEHGPVLVIGGQTLQANPTSISLAGSVLTAGGSAMTVEGTRISLGTSGGLIVGDSTFPIKPIGVSTEFTTTSMLHHTTGVQSTDSISTADPLSGTTIASDGSEVPIGGTLISMKAPVNSISSSGATLASSLSQLAQPTQTASKGPATKLRGGMGLLLKMIASSVAALLLGCINLL